MVVVWCGEGEHLWEDAHALNRVQGIHHQEDHAVFRVEKPGSVDREKVRRYSECTERQQLATTKNVNSLLWPHLEHAFKGVHTPTSGGHLDCAEA